MENKYQRLRNFVILTGQNAHKTDIKIKRAFLGTGSAKAYINPLTEDKAIKRGSEFLAEIFIYGFFLSLGTYEICKSYKDSNQKEKKWTDFVENTNEVMESLNGKIGEIQSNLNQKWKEGQEVEALHCKLE